MKIVLEVSQEGGDTPELLEIGDSIEDIEAKIHERFKGKTAEEDELFLKQINRRDMDRHIQELVLDEYCGQFSRAILAVEIHNYISNLSRVGEVLTIKVLKITDQEWANAVRIGEEQS